MKIFKFKVDGKNYETTSPLVDFFIKHKDGNRLGKRKQKIKESTIKILAKTQSMYKIKEI